MKKSILIVMLAAVAAQGALLTDTFDGGIDAAWGISYQIGQDANTYATNTGAESAFTIGSNPTGKSLLMYDESTVGEVNLRFTMASGNVGDGETMVVQYDFMSPTANPAILANMQVQSGTGKGSNTSFFQNKSGADSNQFVNHNGTANEVLLNTMKEDTWYRFIGEYSPNGAAADSMTITLIENGGTTNSWTKGVQTDKASVNSVLFLWNKPGTSTGNEYYLDNVEISVIPEPATLGLIAAFGTGVMFIRRRFMI